MVLAQNEGALLCQLLECPVIELREPFFNLIVGAAQSLLFYEIPKFVEKKSKKIKVEFSRNFLTCKIHEKIAAEAGSCRFIDNVYNITVTVTLIIIQIISS
jgi:hypothetical protein